MPMTTCIPPTQPRCTNLELPEEVKPCSGFHLLGMQVERQDKDGNDDRGHNLQRDSCHGWRAAASKEWNFPVSLSVEEHSSATLPTSNQPLKKRLFSSPSKHVLVKGQTVSAKS